MYKIYKLTSPSGNSYIGQTKQKSIHIRFKQHIGCWRKWIKNNRPRKAYDTKLFYAFDTYLPEQWTCEQIDQSDTQNEINELEIKYIEQLGYYNLQKGGQGWKNSTLQSEHKKKMSEARKAYFQTPEGIEWKKQLSKKFQKDNPCKKGNIPWNKNKKGLYTEEHLQKISASSKKTWSNEQLRNDAKERMKQMWKDGAFDNRPLPTQESIEKRRIKSLGRKQTDEEKRKKSEALAGTWEVTKPNGEKIIVKGIRKFCQQNEISLNRRNGYIGNKLGWRAVCIKSKRSIVSHLG